MPLYVWEYSAAGTGATLAAGEAEAHHLRDVVAQLAAAGVPAGACSLVVMPLPRRPAPRGRLDGRRPPVRDVDHAAAPATPSAGQEPR